ncbi:MAG: hypothetical protein JW804_05740 [Sedimentisphaerales bacterium]|nr:hypothetical protein [Sedimentisphaerales bacterium]
MKKAKRLIETIILVIIILIGVLLLGFELFGEHIVKVGIETAGTKALSVGVNIDDLDLSIYSGKVGLEGLRVDNPVGYENKYLLELNEGRVKTSMKSLLSDTVEIESILLDGIILTVEQKGLSSNLNDILKSIPKAEPAAKPEEGKNLLVKDLKITNTSVKVKLLPIGGITGNVDTVTLKLDPIEMKDLGSKDKMTTARLAKEIMVALATGVAKQGAGKLPDDMLKTIQGSLGDITAIGEAAAKEATKLLKAGGEEAKEMLDKGGDTGKDIVEGVKGIFDKKEE